MRIFMRILLLGRQAVSVAWAVGLLAACHRATPPAAAPRCVGRCVQMMPTASALTPGTPTPSAAPPGALRLAWSATEVAVNFYGTEVAVWLHDARASPLGRGNLFDVFIDAQPPIRLEMHPKQSYYVLQTALPAAAHRVRLVKRTEAAVGEAIFSGFDVGTSGHLLPPPPALKRRIQILGDSISAGYGNEGLSQHCHFSPATQNVSLTYGVLAAQALQAEATVLAWSGRGLMRNGDGSLHPTLPELRDLALPERPETQVPAPPRPRRFWFGEEAQPPAHLQLRLAHAELDGDPRSESSAKPQPKLAAVTAPAAATARWKETAAFVENIPAEIPAEAAPDAVIINLGTNDFAGGIPDQKAFTRAYTELLAALRQRYPDAYLLCTVGPMLSDSSPVGELQLSAARLFVHQAATAQRQTGDLRVGFLEFPMQTDAQGYGCDWHPNLATHAAMAKKLTGALRDALGW
jgi:lysophospholipase L1-like esterase